MRVINDLIEDLGRLETAKSQVQLRMHTGNAPEIQRKSLHNPSINYRPHLTSHSSAFGISGSVELSPSFGSKSSVNQNHKKMMDNEIESVQFNRKRMNSTVSNSSGARSISGDPSRYGDQVRNVVQSKTAVIYLIKPLQSSEFSNATSIRTVRVLTSHLPKKPMHFMCFISC